MSYDTPQLEEYFFPSSAFGATTESQTHVGPKGKTGYVMDMETELTAAAVGTTSVPEITVGTAAGLTEYGRHRLGTTAILGNGTGVVRASTLAVGGPPVQNDYAGHVALQTARIPADTPFVISRKAGVGGSPAGTGPSKVMIAWS